jgi:hypothetical protein
MHQIFEDGGKYNFLYHILNCFLSSVISTVILRIMLNTLILTEKSILEVKKQETKKLALDKKKKVLKCIIIKYIIFTSLNSALLTIFWYYLTCFNAICNNTQTTLIINSAISFAFSLIYPFIINIIPTIFRYDALKIRSNKKNNNKKGKEFNKQKNKNNSKNNENKMKKNENDKRINIHTYKQAEYSYKVSQFFQIL